MGRRSRSKPKPNTNTNTNGQGSPDFRKREPLPLTQHRPPDVLIGRFPVGTSVQSFLLGECSVIRTYHHADGWHLSIAHEHRYPTWDEIAEARYRLTPNGITMAIVLPPLEEYVNLHPNCFQVTQVRDKQ